MTDKYFRVEPKTMYTAICVACGKDILEFPGAEHVAYTDSDSVREVVGSYADYSAAWACPHCHAPLSDQEAEYQRELREETQGDE